MAKLKIVEILECNRQATDRKKFSRLMSGSFNTLNAVPVDEENKT
jgi:hypothetical protein